MGNMAETIELNEAEWDVERDKFTRRFLGVSADDFRDKLLAGDYDEDPPEMLMEALALFPELD